MAGLIEATAMSAAAHGHVVMLDPAWDIWGPAGGYIAAIALRAARAHADAGHRPVTLTGQFISVARPGAIDVAVEAAKSGSTALFSTRLAQDGRTIFQAQVWTTLRNEPSRPLAPTMPEVPMPHGLRGQDELAAERGMKLMAFWQNIEGRPANFRTATDSLAADSHQWRWMRMRDWAGTDDPFLDAMRHVLLIDIGVWPAHCHLLTEPADYLAPSLDIWVHFHGGATGGDWLLSDAESDISGNGTLSGRVRIWSEDGRALATGGGHCLVTRPKSGPRSG